jgi:dihydrofolate reductase
MKTSLIVAMSENRVIGRDNGLPWHIPEDLRFFKTVTMGKPIIMGRKTFESIGRPLPGRRNIVVSRDPGYSAKGVDVRRSLDDAIALAAGSARETGQDEIFVIGGGTIFEAALPIADRIYLTRIHARIEGDVFFPEIDPLIWKEVWRKPGRQSGSSELNEAPYGFDFRLLIRSSAA